MRGAGFRLAVAAEHAQRDRDRQRPSVCALGDRRAGVRRVIACVALRRGGELRQLRQQARRGVRVAARQPCGNVALLRIDGRGTAEEHERAEEQRMSFMVFQVGERVLASN